jgi:EAL domain-containing protein (putative c-di-GMP-specific phosphodiesterase class I)
VRSPDTIARLGGDEFLLFQPIVALDDGELTGAEALVRWAHRERGVLAPADFIPSAEQSGLIVPLGHWVMRAACRQLAEWSATYGEAAPAVLNVNVSARELREPLFAEQVAGILAGAGLDPDRLMIEITETTALELGTSVHNLSRLDGLPRRCSSVAENPFGVGVREDPARVESIPGRQEVVEPRVHRSQ